MNIILSNIISSIREKTEKNEVRWTPLENKKMMLQLEQGKIVLSYNEIEKDSELVNTLELDIFNDKSKLIYKQHYSLYEKGKDYYDLLELYNTIIESIQMFDHSMQLILDEVSGVNGIEDIEILK